MNNKYNSLGEDVPTNMVNGAGKTSKVKYDDEDDDDQERDINIPIVYDVADVVWVKMGGHPW